jgi:chlorobactene glucosyltransferase
MLEYFFHNQILQIILFEAILLLVVLSNAWVLHRARRHAPPVLFPKVSVLVPARNEEKNIRKCVQSLLAQDYPSFEVLVLDDQSSDGTGAILEEIASHQQGLTVLAGSPAPKGILGKNWACAQLVQRAQGDLLFFTDADTLHQPQTLRATVTALLGEQADMLSGYPRQEMQSWGERLLVPFFLWASLCFNPLWLSYWLRLPALSGAVGQMMLFRRSAYQAIGGHDQLGSFTLDDVMLARRTKAAGLRWRVAKITDLVACRMYTGPREAFDGLARHYFAIFDYRLLSYVFVFAWLAVMFWKPLISLAQLAIHGGAQAELVELVVCVGLALLLWLTAYIELKVPPGLALVYPVAVFAAGVVAIQSLRLSLTGRLTWKERPLAQPRLKWF